MVDATWSIGRVRAIRHEPSTIPHHPALPARLLHARDQALGRELAEADAADAELAIDGAGTAAELAPISVPDRELARRLRLDHLGFGGHVLGRTWRDRGGVGGFEGSPRGRHF